MLMQNHVVFGVVQKFIVLPFELTSRDYAVAQKLNVGPSTVEDWCSNPPPVVGF